MARTLRGVPVCFMGDEHRDFLAKFRIRHIVVPVKIHVQERGNDAGWRRPPIPTTLGEGGPAHLQGNLGFADYSLIRTLLL